MPKIKKTIKMKDPIIIKNNWEIKSEVHKIAIEKTELKK